MKPNAAGQDSEKHDNSPYSTNAIRAQNFFQHCQNIRLSDKRGSKDTDNLWAERRINRPPVKRKVSSQTGFTNRDMHNQTPIDFKKK